MKKKNGNITFAFILLIYFFTAPTIRRTTGLVEWISNFLRRHIIHKKNNNNKINLSSRSMLILPNWAWQVNLQSDWHAHYFHKSSHMGFCVLSVNCNVRTVTVQDERTHRYTPATYSASLKCSQYNMMHAIPNVSRYSPVARYISKQ